MNVIKIRKWIFCHPLAEGLNKILSKTHLVPLENKYTEYCFIALWELLSAEYLEYFFTF